MRNDASDEDLSLMGRPWDDDAARLLVASLSGQHERRLAHLQELARTAASAQRRCTIGSLVGASRIVVADPQRPAAIAMAELLAAPTLAAIGGATLRDSFAQEPHALWSAARGLGSGRRLPSD